MKAKEYAVLDRAVLEGVEYGVMRAFKYTESLMPEQLAEVVHQAVMGSICEWFDLEPAPAEPELPPVKSYCGGVPNYCKPEQPARVRVSGVPYEVDLSDGGHHD